MKIANVISLVAAVGVASSLAVVMPAFAQTNVGIGGGGGASAGIGAEAHGGLGMHGDGTADVMGGIFGTISAVSGNTLTVTAAHPRPMPLMEGRASASAPSAIDASSTVYTVNATNAKIYKGSATTTVSVSAITVGDNVMVQGAVSGTNVTATIIRDGFPRPVGGPVMPISGRKFDRGVSFTPAMQGNGEPVVGGGVTAISGTTLTITNASNVTYTISAASTTIVRNGTSSALSSIAVGDNVLVQGTVNGTSVTASSIIDQGVKGGNASSSANASPSNPHGNGFGLGIGGGLGGFFGAIGGFFRHLFGF